MDEKPARAPAFVRIVEDTGLIPFAAVQDAGSTRAGTLLRLLQILQQDSRASASWLALTEALRKISEGKGMETSSLYAGGTNAVRVMNLHKAKGLEAPVVFLACPCGEHDHDADQYIDRTGHSAKGYFTISRKKGQYQSEIIAQPDGWEEMHLREREFANAEKVRLNYVAATRAKQMLVVSLYPDQPAKCPWTSIMDGMELTPELDVPEMVSGEKAAAANVPDLPDFMAERQRLMERLAEPVFARISVTRQTKRPGMIPEWSAEGRGQVFGSVIHGTLQAVGQGSPESSTGDYVRWLAVEKGLEEVYHAEAENAIRTVLRSEIWQRGRRAKRALYEVSMTVSKLPEEILSGGLASGSAGADTETAAAGTQASLNRLIVKGVVDYVFEEEDGWVIVDFKTDQLEENNLESFLQFYRPQVLAYAREWEKTFGYKVKEAGLLFTSLPKDVVLV